MSSLPPPRIYCPECDTENILGYKDLKRGVFVKCERCAALFNVFDFYQGLYDNVPLATRLADTLHKFVSGDFTLQGGDHQLRTNLLNKLEHLGVYGLIDSVHKDLIIFGNSFVAINPSDKLVTLTNVHLPDFELVIGYGENEAGIFEEKVDKLIQRRNGSLVIGGKDVIHFAYGRLSEPLGFSIYGLWTHMWFVVKKSPEALINASIMGRQIDLKNVADFKKYAEDSVIMGSSVPWFLVKEGKPNAVQKDFLLESFRFEIEMRRSTVARVIERQLLPKLIDGQSKDKEYPSIEWK